MTRRASMSFRSNRGTMPHRQLRGRVPVIESALIEDMSRKRVKVIRASEPGPGLPVVETGGSAHAIVWPGSGAEQRSMHLITLDPGGRTVNLSHDSECVYHVSTGTGAMLDLDTGERCDAITGSMLLIEPGTNYQFTAGGDGAVLLGGPCPPDQALYGHLGG